MAKSGHICTQQLASARLPEYNSDIPHFQLGEPTTVALREDRGFWSVISFKWSSESRAFSFKKEKGEGRCTRLL